MGHRRVLEINGLHIKGHIVMKLPLLPLLLVVSSVFSHGRRVSGQDQLQQITIGRAPESAPMESAKSFESSKPPGELPDAVFEVPEVVVLDATDLDTDQKLKSEDWAFVAVFEGSCYFSERMNDNARSLVIYEGMQVAVAEDGKYVVSFIAEAPLTPVVVRLQLRVSELVNHERIDHGTITLAPIVIEPTGELSDQQPSNTIRIRRTGYSHLLHRLINVNESAADLSLSRCGVARFGSIPEAANYAILSTGKNTNGSSN